MTDHPLDPATRPGEDEGRRLRSLLEAVPHGIQENDTEGTITFSNASHARMLGYEPGELLGKKIWDLLDSEAERPALEEHLAFLVAEEPEPEPYLATSRRKDGSPVETQVEWAYRRDAKGRLTGFISVITDVTAERRSQEALRLASERYRQLFAEAPVMYMITRDHDGLPVVEDCNQSFLDTLGYEKDELVGRPLGELYTPGSRRELEGGGYERALAGAFMAEERQLQTKAGAVIDTLLRAVPERDRDGAVIGTRAMYVDITEQRRLEDQLRQSQKMEALGRLAGGVAHDFNNLLTAIIGYCDLILAGPGLHQDQRRDLLEIKQAGEKAAALTKQLLTFTRQRVPTPTIIDLNAVVEEIGTLLRRTIGADIELVTRLEPSLGRIRANRGQIEQVLLNLAVNARDAMPAGGVLEIATSNVSRARDAASRQAIPGPFVRLSVRDTGQGMDLETKDRVFEPFFTTKPEGQGTGLGLATVYGIVRQCNGSISVASEPGRGSRFELLFPREDADEGLAVVAAPAAGAENAATILLVEDDPAVHELTARILRERGYEVLTAEDPEVALERCREHSGRIDLLLTDVRLPHYSGRELSARVRELHPEARTLLMSGFEQSGAAAGGRSAPELPFLHKPFDSAALLSAIRDALESEPGPEPDIVPPSS